MVAMFSTHNPFTAWMLMPQSDNMVAMSERTPILLITLRLFPFQEQRPDHTTSRYNFGSQPLSWAFAFSVK